MYKSVLLFIVTISLFVNSAAFSANLYVDPATGSDSNTYAQVAAGTHKWATIQRAAWGSTTYASPNTSEAAQEGDTVFIAAGTYSTTGATSCDRWAVSLNPANSGSSGSPITFRGVGTVEIRHAAGAYGPVIGADNRNYIVWDNIYLDDDYLNTCSDTGAVVFHVSVGSQIINSRIKGSTPPPFTDNYNLIRAEETSGIQIRNNELWNAGYGSGENEAAIMTYDSDGILIEHNYIHDNAQGIYIKGEHGGGYTNQDAIIRFNKFAKHNYCDIETIYAPGTQIYQNLFLVEETALMFKPAAGTGTDYAIVNNTFISSDSWTRLTYYSSETPNFSNFRMYNNIFYGFTTDGGHYHAYSSIGTQSYEHNLYSDATKVLSFNEGGTFSNLETFKSTYSQESASPAGTSGDPLFVNTTYYKLQAGSPAKNLGVDILNLAGGGVSGIVDAGAYITGNETIGIETSTSARKLNNVTGVRVTLH